VTGDELRAAHLAHDVLFDPSPYPSSRGGSWGWSRHIIRPSETSAYDPISEIQPAIPAPLCCHGRGAPHSAAMQRANLVARWITQVGKIEPARGGLAPAGRVLDALATVGDAGVVESPRLLRAGTREADGTAIGVRRRLAVDRLGDAEYASLRMARLHSSRRLTATADGMKRRSAPTISPPPRSSTTPC
jgi:hypothetical protein